MIIDGHIKNDNAITRLMPRARRCGILISLYPKWVRDWNIKQVVWDVCWSLIQPLAIFMQEKLWVLLPLMYIVRFRTPSYPIILLSTTANSLPVIVLTLRLDLTIGRASSFQEYFLGPPNFQVDGAGASCRM